MKTRNDFISNSSSCSFILSSGARMADAVKFFAKIFDGDNIPYKLRDEVTVECFAKNKWLRQVKAKLDFEHDDPERQETYEDRWYVNSDLRKDPEHVSWDSVSLDFDNFGKLAADDETLGKIDHILFSCDDGNFAGMFFLRLLYMFFERNGMCPDCSDTEHYFIGTDSDDEKFIKKLASECGGIKR